MPRKEKPLIKGTITRTGLYIKFSEFKKYYDKDFLIAIKALIKKFTLSHKSMGKFLQTRKACMITSMKKEKYLRLPRFRFFSYFAKPKTINGTKLSLKNFKIKNTIEMPERIKRLKYAGGIRDNQPLCVDHIMDNIFDEESVEAGKGGCILNLEAGQGKTYVAMKLIGMLRRKTLIVVHNTPMLEQWHELLQQYFPKANIGIYYGKKHVDGDIVVGIIDSLSMDKITFPYKKPTTTYIPKDYYSQFGMVVVDEAHLFCSAKRSNIFWKVQCPYMLGLSATPDERDDHFDRIVHYYMGDVLVAKDLPGYSEENIPFKGRVKKIEYSGPERFSQTMMTETTQTANLGMTLNRIIQDPYEVCVVAKEAYNLMEKNHDVFVFSDRKMHLELIKKCLRKMKIKSKIVLDKEDENMYLEELENRIQKVTGGASKEELTKAKSNAQVVLTTYGYAATGLSIPKMNAIILATSRKSKSRQTINRIFRLGSNYDIERQIIDIVHVDTMFRKQWSKRKKYYKEKEYEMDTVVVNWNDIEIPKKFMNFLKTVEYNRDKDRLEGIVKDLDVEKSLYKIVEPIEKKRRPVADGDKIDQPTYFSKDEIKEFLDSNADIESDESSESSMNEYGVVDLKKEKKIRESKRKKEAAKYKRMMKKKSDDDIKKEESEKYRAMLGLSKKKKEPTYEDYFDNDDNNSDNEFEFDYDAAADALGYENSD